MAMLLNCSGKVDTTGDFAMVLNGGEYKVALGPPEGRIRENAAGFSYSNSFTVVD
ncbi:MAG: hypothetical protein NT166_13220 [Candidatus Aminicenantes bacterium]|nr:hypothetical protein [Candidatus Aminicenantes bacterium]